MKKPTFTWNVLNWDFNSDKLEVYDVGYRFVNAVDSARLSSLPKNYTELDDYLNSEAHYRFWAKCEYEIIITGWPQQKNEAKIDVCTQLRLNWDRFVKAFWDEVYEPYYLKKVLKAAEKSEKAKKAKLAKKRITRKPSRVKQSERD